jgi:hypothetical protein
LGPDGSGKSTVAARIAAASPLPVRREYLGLYPVARPADGGGAARAGALQSAALGALARRVPGGAGLRRVLRVWRAWARGAVHARRGGLTLFDRHPLEAALGPSPTRRQRLLARSCPAPAITILIDAPAAVVHARKPEHPLGVVEQQRDAYLGLAARRGDVRVVDGDRPLDAVVDDVTSAIWDGWRRRRTHGQTDLFVKRPRRPAARGM